MALLGNEIVLVSGVSPTGGLSSVQEPATAAQIAYLARGGVAPLIVTGISSNATGLLGSVAANGFMLRVLLRNTTAIAVNITVGTTSGGSDVAPNAGAGTLTVPASGALLVDIGSFLKGWFSATAAQPVWLASASWGGAVLNAQLDYEKGP